MWDLDNLEYALENNWQTIEIGEDAINVQDIIDRQDNLLITYEDGTNNAITIYEDGRVYRQDEWMISELLGIMTNWGQFQS